MFSSTANGTSGSHWNIMSSVVCDTEINRAQTCVLDRTEKPPEDNNALETNSSPFEVCTLACRVDIS